MTHDELLAKIDKITLVSCDQTVDLLEKIIPCGECFVCQALYALHSVVELHKPYQHEVVSYVFCKGCTIDLDLAPPYPCPTIQAIEKELS